MPPSLAVNPNLADTILARMENGGIMTAICAELGCDPTAIYYLADRDEAFARRYAHARVRQAASVAEDVVRIADEEPDTSRARVRSDARKWLAGKLDPAKFGDKPQDVNVTISLRDLIKASVTIEHEEFATNSSIPTVSALESSKD
mgnify:FL=1